ncbi:MAG: GNAT family N-acetyltransferase, partial [Solirubrobacteraceae bacterium]
MRVRRVVAGEGEQLRAIRLRALRDAPEAFGSSAEREAAYASAVWAERAAGAETVTFVAVEGPRWIGMAAGRPDGGTVQVLGMWVDPSARGTG